MRQAGGARGPARVAAAAGAGLGATGLAIAAAAAHVAPAHLEAARVAMLERGVQMQMWQALALLAAGALLRHAGRTGWLAVLGLCLGSVMFLAGVYARAVLGVSLGPVAPVGGVTLMASWVVLGIAAARGL